MCKQAISLIIIITSYFWGLSITGNEWSGIAPITCIPNNEKLYIIIYKVYSYYLYVYYYIKNMNL